MRGTLAHVGVLTVRLDTAGARSLKEKRSIVRPVVDRMRARFSVSVARVGGQDSHSWEELAIATVSADPDRCAAILGEVAEWLHGAECRVGASALQLWPVPALPEQHSPNDVMEFEVPEEWR